MTERIDIRDGFSILIVIFKYNKNGEDSEELILYLRSRILCFFKFIMT